MKPTQLEIEKFSKEIFEIVKVHKIGYLDALTTYCNEYSIEPNIAKLLLTPSLKQSIESEAIENNLIKKYPNTVF